MTDATWAVQVSFKTPHGALINLRADRMDEMHIALESFHDLIPAILANESALTGGGNVAAQMPLAPPVQQPAQPAFQPQPQQGPPPEWAQPQQQPQQWQQPAQQVPQQAPMCPGHGMPAKWVKPGISKSSGRPYPGFWACAMPQGQQCKLDN